MRDNFVQIELNKTTWDIPERYQNLSAVGAGAYGQVRYVSQHLYDLIIIILYRINGLDDTIHVTS